MSLHDKATDDSSPSQQRDGSRQVCYLGTFDTTKPRKRIMIRSLREVGWKVTELHHDVWSGVADKSQTSGLFSAVKYVLLLLGGTLSTGFRYVRLRPQGAIVVAYFGHLDLLLAKLCSLMLCCTVMLLCRSGR